MLADEVDYVIGVDTHRDQHVLAVVVALTGAVVAQHSLPADRSGYEAALRFACRYACGACVWAIEGAGHYGAGLTRFLAGRRLRRRTFVIGVLADVDLDLREAELDTAR
jgi:transposase